MPICIEAVTKNFGGRLALDRTSLTVEDGTFVAIVGASGCGKSTLLNMIGGLVPPSEGQTPGLP